LLDLAIEIVGPASLMDYISSSIPANDIPLILQRLTKSGCYEESIKSLTSDELASDVEVGNYFSYTGGFSLNIMSTRICMHFYISLLPRADEILTTVNFMLLEWF
jgi:hypothetical protein